MSALRPAHRAGASEAVIRADGDPAAVAFATMLEEMQPRLHRLELQAGLLGLAIAPLYLASARGSLRHVMACLIHQLGDGLGGAPDDGLCPGTGLRLLPFGDRAGIGGRFHVSDGRARPATGGEVAPWATVPDLGADLLASPAAAGLCRGPVGAALLFDALARHRWMHRETGRKWSTDVSGAHALVSALSGGAGFPHPGPAATGGLVDGEVADLLAGLGWLRMVSTRMPGDNS